MSTTKKVGLGLLGLGASYGAYRGLLAYKKARLYKDRENEILNLAKAGNIPIDSVQAALNNVRSQIDDLSWSGVSRHQASYNKQTGGSRQPRRPKRKVRKQVSSANRTKSFTLGSLRGTKVGGKKMGTAKKIGLGILGAGAAAGAGYGAVKGLSYLMRKEINRAIEEQKEKAKYSIKNNIRDFITRFRESARRNDNSDEYSEPPPPSYQEAIRQSGGAAGRKRKPRRTTKKRTTKRKTK